MQAAKGNGVSRTDLLGAVRDSNAHEEASNDHRAHPRRTRSSAVRRGLRNRGEVMIPLVAALPLALLPIVSLVSTLRWMAVSSR